MGAVYRATDVVLNREVAVKVLQEKFGPDLGAVRRFADEACITGQLQHPAIPPVHDLGTLPDGRPFLAMKLIQGQTFDHQLRERSDPAADRGRFVSIFEQICQAVAYAHAQGIIHRDLKPANVMVGNFGEVQVMDWGLAKLLVRREVQPNVQPQPPREEIDPGQTTAHAQVGESTDDRTQVGQAMGTPAYMPPEQARGEIDRVDQRSDVFALGGVLCAILTGKPPYTGSGSAEVMGKAASAYLHDALARLDGCGAEADLIELCKRCLAAEPTARPADAGEVAKLVSEYRAGVEERLRTAERNRAAAATQAVEQRKRRRVWLGSAAALAVAVVGGLAAVLVVQREAAAELSKKNNELGQKNEDLETANGRKDVALRQAELREQVAVDAVGEYRKAVVDNPTLKNDPQFADLRRTLLEAPAAFCQRLRDDLRADPTPGPQSAVRLARVLYQLAQVRDVIDRKADALAAANEADNLLTESASQAEDWQLTADVLLRKGIIQDALSEYPAALATFSRAEAFLVDRLPTVSDRAAALDRLAKVAFSRALTLSRTKRSAEASVVYAEAASKATEAAALAPDRAEYHFLRFQIARMQTEEHTKFDRSDEALRSVEVARSALEQYRLREKVPELVLRCEADLLGAQARIFDQIGKTGELRGVWERTVAIRRELVAQSPSNLMSRSHLAEALIDLGQYFNDINQPEDALRAGREAREITKVLLQSTKSEIWFRNHTRTWNLEGIAHYKASRLMDSIAAFRELSRLQEELLAGGTASPVTLYNLASNEYNLGVLLTDVGRLDEAMASNRRALDLRRQLVRDHPERPEYRLNVAFSLGNMGNAVHATDAPLSVTYLREAVAILVDLAAKYPKSAAVRDGLARNRLSLAHVLRQGGGLDEAIVLYRENLAANAKDELARRQLGVTERMRDLRPRLAGVVAGSAQPTNPTEAIGFAELCRTPFHNRHATAVRLYSEAFAADPKLAADIVAEHRYAAALAAVRAARGIGADFPADPAGRADLWAKALGWLRADLTLHRARAAASNAAERSAATDKLSSWLKDAALFGTRPGLARIGMPAAERSAWDAFWTDVTATLAKARKPVPAPEVAPTPRAK